MIEPGSPPTIGSNLDPTRRGRSTQPLSHQPSIRRLRQSARRPSKHCLHSFGGWAEGVSIQVDEVGRKAKQRASIGEGVSLVGGAALINREHGAQAIGFKERHCRAVAAILSTLGVMAVLDGLWLGVVARKFYRRHLGGVMAESLRWSAAILFYLLMPLASGSSWSSLPYRTLTREKPRAGAPFLGLLAYGTYDLTNMATLKNWPPIITVVDMGWGAIMTATVAGTATFVAVRVA